MEPWENCKLVIPKNRCMKNLPGFSAILFVFLLISSTSNGQNGLEFAKKVIGTSKASVKDSLVCTEASSIPVSPPALSSTCHSYNYASPGIAIRQAGNISFTSVLVFTDENENINQVSFTGAYNKMVMNDYKKKFKDDYKTITNFLKETFQSDGSLEEVFMNETGLHQVTRWENNSFVYKLSKEEIKKKADRSNAYVIILKISRK